VGTEADRFVIPVDSEGHWFFPEMITPSACDMDDSLDGPVFAWVAFGINSYKVRYCE
jgi:hypothetical protein